MRKNYLIKAKVQEKTFKVKNLEEITEHAECISTGEELTALNMSVSPLLSVDIAIENMYSVNGKVYTSAVNGFFYEKSGNYFYLKFQGGEKTPIVGSVILNGKKETLYIDEKYGKIIDKPEYTIRLPHGKFFASYALRCFSASKSALYFSGPFDFETNSMMLDNCGNINFTSEDGDIIGIYDFSDYLLIVCSKCFYKLTITDGEFKLEKIKTDTYAIEEKSLAKIRDKLLFVANKKLYVYQDYEIKEIHCIYAKNIEKLEYCATTYQDCYYCQVNVPNRKCVLVYDLSKNVSVLVYFGNNKLMYENVGLNKEEQCLYQILQTKSVTSLWRSVPMSFGSNNKKSLIGFSVKVAKAVTLKITGDIESKTFALKAGINQKKMHLRSREFVVEINCPLADIEISNLQFKYIA